MKVALLLTGQPRFLTGESYESIKKEILRNYDVDVFCHTWWEPDTIYQTAPWSGLGTIKISGDVPKIIETIYSPKVLKVEKPKSPQDFSNLQVFKNTSHITTPYNLSSMYLSIQKCYEIFRDYSESNNISYDWVIRLRYDGFVEKFPDLNSLKSGKIYVSDFHGHRGAAPNNGLILSQKFCSQVLTAYTRMEEIYQYNNYLNDEQTMAALFVKDNLPTVFLPRTIFDIGIIRK